VAERHVCAPGCGITASSAIACLMCMPPVHKPYYSRVTLFDVTSSLLRCHGGVAPQGYEVLRLDGSTPPGERQGLVDAFNARASCFLFLISTGAGGVGLNLTGANKVVVFDPSWNPAGEAEGPGARRQGTVVGTLCCQGGDRSISGGISYRTAAWRAS
jgi:hypothetical protein